MPTKTPAIYREYPLDAKDVTAGRLGTANRDVETRQHAVERGLALGIVPAARRAADLEERIREARRIIETAAPDSDFVQVAAAQASIPVLEKHRAVAQQQAVQENDAERAVIDRANGLRYSYDLLRGEIADAETRGTYIDTESQRRLREIAGEPAR